MKLPRFCENVAARPLKADKWATYQGALPLLKLVGNVI